MNEGHKKMEQLITIDNRFNSLMKMLKILSIEEIKEHMLSSFQKMESSNQTFLEGYYLNYNFWGSLNLAEKDYTIFYNRAKSLHEHWEDFLWLYNRLADYRSKLSLYMIINNWFCFESLEPIKESVFSDYFDLDIMKCSKDEVFVDLGAYTGDTVVTYIENYGKDNYKRIYCYEITPLIFEELKQKLQMYPNIEYRQKGASDQKGILYLNENMDYSANILSSEGSIAIETVTIDEDITEPVTFIKMDIEGLEQKALLGCKEHIRKDRPKLALSVYHNNEDLWKIPRMIDEMCKNYQFYLRYHGGRLSPSEISLLAVCE